MASIQKWVFFYEDTDFNKIKVSERECKKPERTKNWKETRNVITIPFRSVGAMIAEEFYKFPYKEHQK